MNFCTLHRRFGKADISAKLLWILCLAAAAFKILLCSFQYMYASPELSPIDDTLMVNLAQSISAGNWLGEYNWLTMSKHSFFALWLAFLNAIHLNVLVGGQLLFAGACFVLLAALKPALKTNLARLFVFGITLFTPATWAESSLRVYRDNIYPALLLYVLAAFVGAFLRYKEAPRKAIPYYIAAGLAMGAAWLTHEDNALLLPFIFCAAAAYFVFVFGTRQSRGEKIAKAGLFLVPFLLWGGCLAAWSGMNYQYYGRFIISDFTSSEFNDAMGAFARVCPEEQQRYNLIPYSTRLKLYEVSPTFATVQPYLENDEIYNGYGSVETKELNSGGVHWAIRKAAGNAGYYKDAKTAEQFYSKVAEEVNEACEKGLVPSGKKRSGIFAPFKPEYLMPTAGKFFDEARVFLLFEQTRPTALLSVATPEQSENWESYLHCTSTKAAVENTNTAYFPPLHTMAYHLLNACTWIQRVAVWPMLALSCWWLASKTGSFFKGIKKKELPEDTLASILMLGVFLTGILRMAAIAYLMGVTLGFDIYLMYLNAACAPLLWFIAYGSAKWVEEKFDGAPPAHTV